jgi:RNA polymerase sigma-70 factor (ECF subfamily)
MTESDGLQLRDLLVFSYESFRRSLARRLGSDAYARDALHDVYIRLNRNGDISALHPRAYLFRMALNVATDRLRSDRRRARWQEMDALIPDLPCDQADPMRVLTARQDVALLESAILELTPRRRHILLGMRLHGRTLAQLAAELDVSQRLIELELKQAVTHCAQRLGRPVVRRFGPKARIASPSPEARPS